MEIDMRREEERPRPAGDVIEKPIDKRSTMVDRKVAPRQVLCFVCCAEFGTNSLPIHLKTCLKKHDWGLNNIANDETISKKAAARNRKKCCVPGDPPSTALPSVKSPLDAFEEYNREAQQIFFDHAAHCLWCRTQNVEAMEAARRAEEDARRRAEEEEAFRRARELEDERRRRWEADDEEARRRALQDEEERRRADEAAKRKLLEDEARRRAEEEVAKWLGSEEDKLRRAAQAAAAARRKTVEDAEVARRRAAEEEARRLALEAEEAEAEERRKRLMAQGKHKFLRKGEGVQAATESGQVYEKAKLEEKAKHDIAYYSLNHAKKEGLVVDNADNLSKVPAVLFKEVEVDEGEWKKQWSPEQEAAFSKSVGMAHDRAADSK